MSVCSGLGFLNWTREAATTACLAAHKLCIVCPVLVDIHAQKKVVMGGIGEIRREIGEEIFDYQRLLHCLSDSDFLTSGNLL